MPLYLGKQKINKVLTEYSTTLVTLDTTDATATADKIFLGETAYANKEKITGTFTINNELDVQKNAIKNIKNSMKDFGATFPNAGGGTLESVEWTQGGNVSYPIAYGNGVWVSANFHYSTDGISWQAGTINLNISANDLKFGNGVFVATTSNNGIYYSTDGITWTQATGDAETDGTYLGIGFNGSEWVVCGSVDEEFIIATNYPLLHSTDGINWTAGDWSEFNGLEVAYGGGKWIMAGWGFILYSENGLVWDSCEADWDYYNDVCYNNGTWIIVGTEGIYRSTDAYTFTRVDDNYNFTHVNYANGVWMATGDKVYYSTDDGVTWIESQLTGAYACKPKFIDGLWIIAGENGIFYSADGINWTQTNVTSGSEAAYVTKENGILFANCNGPYYSEGTYAAVEMTYNEELQQNNNDLSLILNQIGNIDISSIYISENDAEPDASVGADGDLWLVVDSE